MTIQQLIDRLTTIANTSSHNKMYHYDSFANVLTNERDVSQRTCYHIVDVIIDDDDAFIMIEKTLG